MTKKISIFCTLALLSMAMGCTRPAAPGEEQAAGEGENAAPRISYRVSFPHPSTHYACVELNISGLTDSITHLCMPAWAPGYYIILNSARHVVDFDVAGLHSGKLPWRKSEKSRWTIHNGKQSELNIFYRVYANRRSVGEAMVSAESAYLPGNEIFMYLEGNTQLPCEVTVVPHKEWSQVVTSLRRDSAQQGYRYSASHFDELFDSPFYLGNQLVKQFEHEGKRYTLSVACPQGMDTALFVSDVRKVIGEATRLMGEAPYDHYVFMLLGPGRGGLEHGNSQADFFDASQYRATGGDRASLLNFVTHEYFHLYNVKRIRPIELGPFDYSRENYASLLWFSEGATCYYENVLNSRAGLMSGEQFLEEMHKNLLAVENDCGRRHMTLDRSAIDIWNNFFDGDNNGTRISYYDKGPLVSMILDLALRNATDNAASLDDLMRLLYNRYHKGLGRGFTEAEFWRSVDEVSGGADLSEVKSYVYTTDEVDYVKYFGYAGIDVDLTPTHQQNNREVVQRSWRLSFAPQPTPRQQALRDGIMLGR